MLSARLYFQIIKNLQFSRFVFSKITQTSNCTKIRTVGAVLFHADGQTQRAERHIDSRSVGRTDGRTGRQTDMAKLIVAFSNSVKASRNCKWNSIIKFRQVCTP